MTLAQKSGALSWRLRAATDLARLWSAASRADDAFKLLSPIYSEFNGGGIRLAPSRGRCADGGGHRRRRSAWISRSSPSPLRRSFARPIRCSNVCTARWLGLALDQRGRGPWGRGASAAAGRRWLISGLESTMGRLSKGCRASRPPSPALPVTKHYNLSPNSSQGRERPRQASDGLGLKTHSRSPTPCRRCLSTPLFPPGRW
jgi:hypothetical protein